MWIAERTIAGVDASRDELLPFVGPPAALPLWGAFARLAYGTAARLWWAALFAAALALALLVLRASGAAASWPAIAALFALTVGFGPVSSDLALGQIPLVSILGAAVAAYAASRGRWWWTAIGSFAALLQPNVAAGSIAVLGRIRTAAAFVTGAAAVYAAGAVAAGWAWPAAYARRVLVHGTGEAGSAIQFTPAAIAHGFGASPGVAAAIGLTAAAVAIAAGAYAWRRIGDTFARFAALSALAPFAAGFFHEHDLAAAYVAAAWCALRSHGQVRAIALAATLFTAVDWLGLAQRPTGIVQSALLAAAVACAFLAMGSAQGGRAGYVTPLAAVSLGIVAVVFGWACWLAAHHPLPVWPDALGAYHAPAAATAAQVWHEEQRRTGLFAAEPVWSILRCLSLLGCGLLAWCVTRTESTLLFRQSDEA
ncbi:MAG TPA: glycosyltransferase 87 family protein [Candidatus Tumulicola sp.]|nr:glycosyltransferase 87 family protein [Candidatus Tumulicola sp.]